MTAHYDQLIEKFYTFFRVRDTLTPPYSSSDGERFRKPFVTIAREPGSGGAPIAAAVAKKLGFKCIDEQVSDEIATSTKLRKEMIQAVDEKRRTVIEDMVQSLLNAEYVDDLRYVAELTKVVVAHALNGDVVIVGRGANFLTPLAKGLHVNITAPYETRVERAMLHEGFTRRKAEKVIADVERERKEFVKQYFRKDPDKVNSYDLSLNTANFSVDQARDVIIDAFWRKFPKYQSALGFLKRG